MIDLYRDLGPGEFSFVLGMIDRTKYDFNEAIKDVKSLIGKARQTDTNTLNYQAQSFVGQLSHLGGALDDEITGRMNRSIFMLREMCKVIRTRNKTTIAQFMRENFIRCPQSVAVELIEACGEKDIPIGDSLCRWGDIGCSLGEIGNAAYSGRPMTWSWIGMEN